MNSLVGSGLFIVGGREWSGLLWLPLSDTQKRMSGFRIKADHEERRRKRGQKEQRDNQECVKGRGRPFDILHGKEENCMARHD